MNIFMWLRLSLLYLVSVLDICIPLRLLAPQGHLPFDGATPDPPYSAKQYPYSDLGGNDHPRQAGELGKGSCMFILTQMTLALVLGDYISFKHYSKSFVIPFVIRLLQAQETDPDAPL